MSMKIHLSRGSKKFFKFFSGFLALLVLSSVAVNLFSPGQSELVSEGETRGVASDSIDFGNGRDGALVISENTIDRPIDSIASGTVGTNILSATNPLFEAGQKVFIHQSRGVNHGTYEENEIASYTAGTITLVNALKNSYKSSGKDAAQVIVKKQYTDVTVQAGKTLVAKWWSGSVGGILAFDVSGTLTVDGTITANGRGFRGGTGGRRDVVNASSGEGELSPGITGGTGVKDFVDNNGGGGGNAGSYRDTSGGGQGAGHATDGGMGERNGGRGEPDRVGEAYGTPTLALMDLGAGGGGGYEDGGGVGDFGGRGGGILFLSAPTITVSGYIRTTGYNGEAGTHQGGGAGAGGSILLRVNTANLRNGAVGASGGVGGNTGPGHNSGGDASVGRIRIEYCDSVTGTTIPLASMHQLTCTPPNEPPVAVAGSSLDDQGQLQLDGSLSSDPDGDETIVSYEWEIDSQTRSGEIVSVSDLASGEYTVKLTVTDDKGESDSDTILLGIPVRSISDPIGPVVEETSPIGGATGVGTNTNITVRFSENMNVVLTEAAFSISPTVLGKLSMSGKTLMFIPNGKLTSNTSYTITIGASATDLAGNPLGTSFSFTFETGK